MNANAPLTEFLSSNDWFDNHRIETILDCRRKGFWHLIGPPQLGKQGPGLSLRVGTGADFGTCAHAAHAVWRQNWQLGNDPFERSYPAFQAFEKEWLKLFPHGPDNSSHSLERGIAIMDAFFERFNHESALYKPIDPEMAFAIRIRPRPGEPHFEPFHYAGRLDGIDERLATNDLCVEELKTTSGGVSRRLKSLGRSRQPKGYVWAAREILKRDRRDPELVTGFMGTVILVAAKKVDFSRDYFPVSLEDTESWRRQTINIVEEWRWRRRQYEEHGDAPNGLETALPFRDWRALFPETTENCFKYGECPFTLLCNYGPSSSNLADYTLDVWSPAGSDIQVEREPQRTVIIEESDQ